MRLRLIRLRFRRRLHKGQQQVEDFGQQAEQTIERHFFHRLSHLGPVRRFITAWLLLVLLLMTGVIVQLFLLGGYFQTLRPVEGGIYNEGVLGAFTNANPIYATSDVDATVSHLIFAGLFSFNDQNRLTGDLASSYSVNAKGTIYTVHLKPNLSWQDGRPLNSADVAFTYHLIQNPDAQSPLQNSWQGINVDAPNPTTVTFRLPNPLASFPYSLTTGIVPKHLLASIPAANMRSAEFNTVHPVGAGPFAWQAIQVAGDSPDTAEEQIALTPFARYQAGEPKLRAFVVHAYAQSSQLARDFKDNLLNGAEGLTTVPASIKAMSSLQIHNFLLSAATMVFFKTSSGVLADGQLRQALVKAANVPSIIARLDYPTMAVREPLLKGQLAYDPAAQQASFNLPAAQSLLTGDGWLNGKDGLRHKNGQTLNFGLTAADTPEYHTVASLLRAQWRRLGVQLRPQFLQIADFQTALAEHDYDAVLYGISIGVDPDVFAYWDSSQADIRSANRLNLSEYKSSAADAALEAGRTRLDPALRIVKYQPFLRAWQQDAPALGLYQPRLLYLTDGQVAGLRDHTVNTSIDRFSNVQNWEIREAKVTD